MNTGLSARHRHGGGSGDGERIKYRDLEGIPKTLFVPGGAFASNDGNAAYEHYFQYACMTLPDSVTGIANASFKVPDTYSQIKSMKVIFYNDNSSSDVLLRFFVHRATIDVSNDSDTSDGLSSYTTGATTVQAFTIPAAAYDAIGKILPGDIIGVQIQRSASAGGDTYNDDFRMIGLLVEFSR